MQAILFSCCNAMRYWIQRFVTNFCNLHSAYKTTSKEKFLNNEIFLIIRIVPNISHRTFSPPLWDKACWLWEIVPKHSLKVFLVVSPINFISTRLKVFSVEQLRHSSFYTWFNRKTCSHQYTRLYLFEQWKSIVQS